MTAPAFMPSASPTSSFTSILNMNCKQTCSLHNTNSTHKFFVYTIISPLSLFHNHAMSPLSPTTTHLLNYHLKTTTFLLQQPTQSHPFMTATALHPSSHLNSFNMRNQQQPYLLRTELVANLQSPHADSSRSIRCRRACQLGC